MVKKGRSRVAQASEAEPPISTPIVTLPEEEIMEDPEADLQRHRKRPTTSERKQKVATAGQDDANVVPVVETQSTAIVLVEQAQVSEPETLVHRPDPKVHQTEDLESEPVVQHPVLEVHQANEESNDNDEDNSDDEEENSDSGEEGSVAGGGQKRRAVNEELYPSFKFHIASKVLKGEEHAPLKCKQHKAMNWNLELEDEGVHDIVKGSVLYTLVTASYPVANRALLSAFVERWHPETNTFHLPFGEMTITLDDVYEITRLPIKGKFLTSKKPTGGLIEYCARTFGIHVADVTHEIRACNSNLVRFSWLRKTFSKEFSKDRAYTLTDQQVARAYLLHLLGCTLFADKTGDKVPVKYLQYLEDLDKIDQWAWGTAGLAYLYRMLGSASRIDAKTVSGYVTLFEAWIYEHFPDFMPMSAKKIGAGVPRYLQWSPKSKMSDIQAKDSMVLTRIKLDGLKKNQVNWTPYRPMNADPDEIVWFFGVVMLDKVTEPYHPDRVVRQFGRIQGKPDTPQAPDEEKRKDTKSYMAKYQSTAKAFLKYRNHLVNVNDRGDRMTVPGECTNEYEEWYTSKGIRHLHCATGVSTSRNVQSDKDARDKAIEILEEAKANKKITKAHWCKVADDVIRILREADEDKEKETDAPSQTGEQASTLRGQKRKGDAPSASRKKKK